MFVVGVSGLVGYEVVCYFECLVDWYVIVVLWWFFEGFLFVMYIFVDFMDEVGCCDVFCFFMDVIYIIYVVLYEFFGDLVGGWWDDG